jgi:pimeloyl-ACP methyl ester carboxylesterase
MIDYVGRYKHLAEYLTGEGYILAGNHHLGHGRSVSSSDDYGFFAEKDGVEIVIKDMHTFNRYLRDTFPTLPLVVMGHSMGSFITRLYIEKYPHSIKGAVIHGTAGPNPALPMGKLLAKIIIALRGGYHKSNILKGLAIGAYQKKYKKEGKNAWLSTDADMIADQDWFLAASTQSALLCKQREPLFPYPVQVFRIGNIAIVGMAGEPFTDGGFDIKLRSKAALTYITHMANRYVGYLPKASGYDYDAHESNFSYTNWSKLKRGSLEKICDAIVDGIDKLFEE